MIGAEWPRIAPKIAMDIGAQKVAFQSPCSLQHGLQLSGRVEEILQALGLELTPVADSHLCCGSAGTYSLLQPELSSKLKAAKLKALEAGRPDVIATANIGCLAHLAGGTKRPVRHWIELLDARMLGGETRPHAHCVRCPPRGARRASDGRARADRPGMNAPARADYRHFLAIATRWMDNDSYGHVNNVTYYSYFDTVVNEHLIRVRRARHRPAIRWSATSSRAAAASRKPLTFPEMIDAGLRVVRLGTSSVTYEIGIFRQGDDEPAATGRFVHVWVDRANAAPRADPAADPGGARAARRGAGGMNGDREALASASRLVDRSDPPARRIALIPAAGGGSRFGGGVPKQYADLAGKPLLARTIERLAARPRPRCDRRRARAGRHALCRASARRRPASKRSAAAARRAPRPSRMRWRRSAARCGDDDWILVHDAARPCVPVDALARLVAELADDPVGGLLAIPVADTLKREDRARRAARAAHRGSRRSLAGADAADVPLRRAARRVRAPGALAATDEGGAVEALAATGACASPRLVVGSALNIKVTLAADLALAAAILALQDGDMTNMRIGNGFDVHALVAGRRLVLGGVDIPYERGLDGHSDADVLLHAVCDAILGALALGDIGMHFPDTDPRWKDADSRVLLRHVAALAADEGWRVGNLDVTVIAQAPKLAPHVPAMRANLAADLACDVGAVSVKATTTERLGFTGRGEGIAAHGDGAAPLRVENLGRGGYPGVKRCSAVPGPGRRE